MVAGPALLSMTGKSTKKWRRQLFSTQWALTVYAHVVSFMRIFMQQ
jgi:hypothetical protein